MLAAQAVPEPSSLLLISCLGIVALGLRSKSKPAVSFLIVAMIFACSHQSAKAQLSLFEEDFESAVLGASPEEDPTQTAVWTETFPGWTFDDSGMPQVATPNPEDGVVDWSGWALVNKDFWIDAAGDQTRTQFTRGQGNVLVADPDEWDDDDPVDQTAPFDFYDAIVRTPVINIPAGIPAGKVRVAFDSSWRPEGLDDGAVGNENNQTATLNAIYNGGGGIELLKFQSDPNEDDFKDDAQNEGIDLDAQYNGSATTVQLEFYLGNAWNDWWWAVDNLRVFVPAEPSVIQVDVGTGGVTLVGGDVINVDINSLDIQSANGVLNAAPGAGLSSIQPDSVDGADADSIVGNSLGENWELAASNEYFFSEFFLEGSSPFTDARSESLGQIFDVGTAPADRDIVFTYTNIFGTEVEGVVEYVGMAADADFDADNDVDGADFLAWQSKFGTSGPLGDANGDGNVNGSDLSAWNGQYGSGGASVGSTTAIPEPNGAILMLLASLALGHRTKRDGAPIAPVQLSRGSIMNRAKVVFSIFILGIVLTTVSQSYAQVPPPFVDRDYNFGENDISISAGDQVTQTRDFAGTAGVGQQLVHLNSFNAGGASATYENVVGRPDGGTGLGILLNGVSVFGNPYARRHNLRTFVTSTGGAQLALNLPIRSPTSTESDFGTGSIDYKFITDRGFQLWVQPANLPAANQDSHIVMDSNNHGVFIQNDGTFAMRYAGQDYSGETQITQATIDNDQWYHLMVVRPFGPSSGSILYVNGVAEAAATGTYLGEQDLTAEEVLPPNQIEDSPLVIGANTDENPSVWGSSDYYSGMVDDLEMFVLGFNNSADYGEFDFERDNKFAAFAKPSVQGDLTGEGDITMADVQIFADNWLFEKRLEWTQGADERSLRVGDLSTRALGDFDYSGRIDLRDWEILNDQSPALAAAAMALIQGVPEPSTLMLSAIASLVATSRSRRKSASLPLLK